MSKKLSKEEKNFLQNMQDVLSSLSSLPIKVYNENGDPVTRWSNPTFIHWLTDYHEFDYCDENCRKRAADFNNIAKILSEKLKENVRETINSIKEVNTFRLLKEDNIGPEYALIPVNLFDSKLYILIGGLWILNPGEDKSVIKNNFIKKFIEKYNNDSKTSENKPISFTENKLIFDESQDLPVMYRNDFDRRMVSLLRSFWSIRHF